MNVDNLAVLQDAVISTTTLAAIIGVSAERVRQLADEGVIKSAGRNAWNLSACVQNVIAHHKAAPVKSDASERLLKAKAEALEMATITKGRELQKAAMQELIETVDGIIGPLRGELQSIPARVTADLNIRLKVEREINAVLTATAKRLATFTKQET